MRSVLASIRLLPLGLVVLFPACFGGSSGDDGLEGGDGVVATGGGGVGFGCSPSSGCRVGLSCSAGTCVLGHSTAEGSPCKVSGECQPELVCGMSHRCEAAGPDDTRAPEGATCQMDAQCKSGLRCDLIGLAAVCHAEGSKDVGEACTLGKDCLGGLSCAGGTCSVPPAGLPAFAGLSWDGEPCAEDSSPPQAYFRVPRGQDDGDFYRLPFPNDIRRKNGRPDYSGHPLPGADLFGFDLGGRYIDAIQSSSTGFGAYATILFRFGAPLDLGAFNAGNVVRFLDITEGAPEYGQGLGSSWLSLGGDGKYVCKNWLGVRPWQGQPLLANHTYTVMITDGGTSLSGPYTKAEDFKAVIGDKVPSEAALVSAHAAYAPLRKYLKAESIDPSTLLTAAVFTVGNPQAPMQKIAASVASLPAPATSGWVKCGVGPSPCPDTSENRACGEESASFDEYHAMVSLPIYQAGKAPYVEPADGGGIDTSGASAAPVRSEDVCLSMTVPKTAPPEGGFPVVVYAHGTGGSFRSHVNEGVAEMLAQAAVDGVPVPMVVMGIDQVQHGPRRNGSTTSPELLFFNFANPAAALGNPLQGAADQLSLAKLGASLDLDPTIFGGATLDHTKVLFWGHSQGATEGGIAMPYSPQVSAVVFSGQGASLIDSLLNKTKPVDIAAAIPFALRDADPTAPTVLRGGEFHPILSVLQSYIDPADPLNHARFLALSPPVGMAGHHVFQPYGVDDSYSPPKTEATFARAAGLSLVGPAYTNRYELTPGECKDNGDGTCAPVTLPMVSGNVPGASAEITLTAAVREYQSDGSYDGHFVATRNATASADVVRFLSEAALGKVPTVGQ
jgi:hypothetical protein